MHLHWSLFDIHLYVWCHVCTSLFNTLYIYIGLFGRATRRCNTSSQHDCHVTVTVMLPFVWCSVVQCGAVWCSVLQCGAVWCSVVQCSAVCCTVTVMSEARSMTYAFFLVRCSMLQCVAVCCSVLQCVCSAFAVCCSVLHRHGDVGGPQQAVRFFCQDFKQD